MKRIISLVACIMMVVFCVADVMADRLPGSPSTSATPQGSSVTARVTLSGKSGYYAFVSFQLSVIYNYTGYGPYPKHANASGGSSSKGKGITVTTTIVPNHAGDTIINYSISQVTGYYEN